MKIPRRLSYILERDQALDGAVKYAISQFEPWIRHSHLPFFPEYTDHGLEHVESVLITATALIRDEAWGAVTAADSAVLVLSVLLHDCAMHISEEGFFSLLDPERSREVVSEMRDKPWNHLWEDFIGEAARFDGRQLVRLFGDALPVRRPPMDPNALTRRDRLLIGEFLRRHHPRLAQEIALFGVPTSGSNPLVLSCFTGGNQYIARLSGLVARSHGADIRAFLPVLRDEFDVRQFKGVHAVILMVLLRVADYLQIDAERAPSQVLQVNRLASPVSEGEWKAHHAIKDIRHTHEDPEAIFIDADPVDVDTFLRVRGWLNGIQHELDVSWAVLGEIYGRYEGIKEFGIILRRVRSSLDDVELFSRRASYLPVKAMFRAADADLLKLLIEPLYGDHPEIGLREMVQNAVDACRELKEYRKDLPLLPDIEQTSQEGDVVVRISHGSEPEDEAWVTISDKGIGMTADTVINYFLAAGASFRRSENWRKDFESENGKSKVLRAGRFGVGALAGFLLGSEIEVSTRHVDESHGLFFKASVESDAIELMKHDRPVGTTVAIRILRNVADQLMRVNYRPIDGGKWDWYCLSEPSVVRFYQHRKLKQKFVMPALDDEDVGVWHRIYPDEFSGIQWTYDDAPSLVCNGILIGRCGPGGVSSSGISWTERNGFVMPKLAVFDPDGKLPLDLQRAGLVKGGLSFEDELLNGVCQDFIAFCLARGPSVLPVTLGAVDVFGRFMYRGTDRANRYSREKSSHDWYFTSKGFGYIDAPFFAGQKSILIVRVSGSGDRGIPFSVSESQSVIPVLGDETLTGQDAWVRKMFDYGFYKMHADDHRWAASVGGKELLKP